MGGQEQESQKLQLPLFPDTLEAFPFSKISFLFQINKPPASINLLAKTHVAPNLSAGRAEMPAGAQETPRPGLLGAGAAPSARGSPAPPAPLVLSGEVLAAKAPPRAESWGRDPGLRASSRMWPASPLRLCRDDRFLLALRVVPTDRMSPNARKPAAARVS